MQLCTSKRKFIQTVFLLSSAYSLLGLTTTCQLTLNPVILEKVQVSNKNFPKIIVNCSCCIVTAKNELHESLLVRLKPQEFSTESPGQALSNGAVNTDEFGGIYRLRIISLNRHIAQPSKISYRLQQGHHEECTLENEFMCSVQDYSIPVSSISDAFFYVEINQVGRAVLQASLVWWNSSEVRVDASGNMESPTVVITSSKLKVTAIRKPRHFYTMFDYSAVFIACMTALTVGCCTDTLQLKRHLRSPLPIVLGGCCQHIIMPIFGLAVAVITGLPNDLAYGLFATCTLPGGGLAHLIVFLMDGDRSISTSISLLNTILNTAISAVWLLCISWHFSITIHVAMYVLWLLPGLVAHLLGIVLRHFRPVVAEAVMTWFTRPILLLSGILLITLGVYINHYAFHYIDYSLVTALVLTIFGGFCIGGLAGYIIKQEKPVRKALAAETSVFNCLLIIPALRHALNQPEADLAATVPLWGVFFTPAPILLYFVAHKIKNTTLRFIERRKEKQYRHYSIVSSLGKMAQEVGAVSAQVAKDEDQTQLGLCGTPPIIEKQEKTTSL